MPLFFSLKQIMVYSESPKSRISKNENQISCSYTVNAYQKNDKLLCHIPCFELMFQAENEEEVKARSQGLIHRFIGYYKDNRGVDGAVKYLNKLLTQNQAKRLKCVDGPVISSIDYSIDL